MDLDRAEIGAVLDTPAGKFRLFGVSHGVKRVGLDLRIFLVFLRGHNTATAE